MNWSSICTSQEKRPPNELEDANYASGVVAAVSFAVAALYSALWWVRWIKWKNTNKMWQQLGLFSGFMCVGSAAGVVTWVAKFKSEDYYLVAEAPGATRHRYYSFLAASLEWYAVFYFMYGVEFLCLVAPKLLLLDRLMNNAIRTSQFQVPTDLGSESHSRRSSIRALPLIYRLMAASIAACSIIGMVAYAAAGVYSAQTVPMYHRAAFECDSFGKDTNASTAINEQLFALFVKVDTAQSVQNFTEAIALLLISITYMLIVPWCIAIFRHAERLAARAIALASDQTGRQGGQPAESLAEITMMIDATKQAAADQRRRLVAACIIVLVTFPARASFDLLNAYGSFDNIYNKDCEHCGTCQSDQWLVWTWLQYTPEFQPIVVTISSPLPLIVSLWLITTAHARALAIAANVHAFSLGR